MQLLYYSLILLLLLLWLLLLIFNTALLKQTTPIITLSSIVYICELVFYIYYLKEQLYESRLNFQKLIFTLL